jgi:hypothetical protein
MRAGATKAAAAISWNHHGRTAFDAQVVVFPRSSRC